MTAFAYSAINAQGLALKGELHALDAEAATQLLHARGLLPQSLSEVETSASGAGTVFKKVKPKSLQIFSRQFATLVEAGVNIVSALLILEEQTDDQVLAVVIAEVRAEVEAGRILSKAFARHPRVFNRLYCSMIEAGEASGTLDRVLDRAAVQIEKETQLKRRVKGALVYPIVVLSFATLVLVGMLLFIVPVFVNIFKQLNGNLPTITSYVLGASNLLRHHWYVILPLLALAAFGLIRAKRTERGRRVWDHMKLRMPMRIGDVVLKVTMARFSRTLASLVAAGVDIVKALEITAAAAGNRVVEDAVITVRHRVREGAPIAQPLIENPVFPPMVGQMIKIGEETGELEKMLGKIADFYEDEVDTAVGSLTAIIEPVLMIGVGVMVGVIVISMYLPMFRMLQLVQ